MADDLPGPGLIASERLGGADRAPRWWALALSEQVTADKPLASRCGELEVVLFRDRNGAAFAFEDRCPHRRVPLSMGRMKDGLLQCGYHGWTFEGGTGRCVAIPNLRPDEAAPDRYGVATYAAAERGGLVYVWTGAPEAADPERLPSVDYAPSGREHSGSTVLPLAHGEFVAALFDGPQALLDLAAVRLIDFVLGQPRPSGGFLTFDRGAGWRGPHLPDRFVPDWPLVFRTSAEPETGLATVEVRDRDEKLFCSAIIASAPVARGATAVRWRSSAHPAKGLGGALIGALSQAGVAPIAVKPLLDGEVLAALREGPSLAWRRPSTDARSDMAGA